MKSKLKFVLIIALIVFGLDHITKWMIVDMVPFGTRIPIIPNIFDIVHGRNTGAAFGVLSDWDSPFRDWFFYIVGLVALVFLYYYIKSVKKTDRIVLVSLAMILGGACGNIFDRIFRGSVVDFLSIHYYSKVYYFTLLNKRVALPLDWPAFNVADAAISTAVVLLLIEQYRAARKDQKIKKSQAA